MIVAVYGSWYSERGGFLCRGTLEQVAQAGRELGELLAQLRKRLVITSFTSNTVDGFVAEGYLNWLDANSSSVRRTSPPLIYIIEYDDKQVDGIDERSYDKFAELFANRGHFVTFVSSHGMLRFDRHLAGLQLADVVITLGGADHTFMAGEVAILAGKPLIPIAAFGGASRNLLEQSLSTSQDAHKRARLGKLFGPWGDEVRTTVESMLSVMRVAIVHGRDEAWRAVREIVDNAATTEARFETIVMREEFSGSESLPVKWETVAASVVAAIAVLTPDDFGGVFDGTESPRLRARQNVWLEIGWVWGRLGRRRLLLLVRGDVEIPSDFAGIETLRYTSQPSERLSEIGRFLSSLT